MKNLFKYLGLIAFCALIGFYFTSCDIFDEQTVEISGTAQVGKTISAKTNKSHTTDFYWQFSAVGEAKDWSGNYSYGDTSGSYKRDIELRTGSEGRYIRAYIRKDNGDTFYSNVLGPILPY